MRKVDPLDWIASLEKDRRMDQFDGFKMPPEQFKVCRRQ
jgi:hypothetical protein